MKAKKVLLLVFLMIAAIFAVFAFGIKSKSNLDGDKNIQQLFELLPQDTIKFPEAITEKRSTQIEIVNGKKKIKETIIKMKGDSIIEKKVIEREENTDKPFLDLDTGVFSGGFYFKQLSPDDLDSLSPFGQNIFGEGVEDSLLKGFNFSFSPNQGFHIKPFGNFEDDLFKHFDFGNSSPNMLDLRQMQERIKELMDRMQRGFQPNPNFDYNDAFPDISPDNKPKSMKEIITDYLLTDGFIKDIEDDYKFEINEKWLKINGKKQSKELYEKYKGIIEDNTGVELEDEFDFKFNNKKKLGGKTRKI